MKKFHLSLLATLLAVSPLAYGEEQKEPEIQITEQMAQFADAYENELKSKLGFSDIDVSYTNTPNGLGIVIKIDHDISLRYSRAVLVDAVEALQQIVGNNATYQAQFPANLSDYHNISLVIDTYDEKRKPKENYGVSSVILFNGNVSFMGISHHTGKEVLIHRQPYSNAVRVVQDQGLR